MPKAVREDSTPPPRYISAWERATTFQIDSADTSPEALLAAAAALRAIADVDLRPLERPMSTDSCGNPIRRTPEQVQAWSTYCEAVDVRDRADSWVRALELSVERRRTAHTDGSKRPPIQAFAADEYDEPRRDGTLPEQPNGGDQ